MPHPLSGHKGAVFIESIETDEVSLEAYSCQSCQFHFALDATYFDQVGEDIDMPCPSCKSPIHIEGEL